MRQIDKSINNSIGTVHEQILGGIKGYEAGNMSGYDIKAKDNTLFADIKNKHNTMNSSSAEALFQKLVRYADDYKKAKCYWVQILAKVAFVSYGVEILTEENMVIAEFTRFLETNFMLYFQEKKMLCFNYIKYFPQLFKII